MEYIQVFSHCWKWEQARFNVRKNLDEIMRDRNPKFFRADGNYLHYEDGNPYAVEIWKRGIRLVES